jgi:ribonuclease BN (tRNA processing enzyme)
MKLTILGSGTCTPSLKRGSPANYLQIGKSKVLIDCGPGFLHKLLKAGLQYEDIDIVFVTHFHVDHICDLNAFTQALNVRRFNRKKELTLIGPVGFKKFYETYLKPIPASQPWRGGYEIKIKEIKKSLNFNGFGVECTKTIHSDPSIAYKFKEKGKSLVVFGDCDYDKKLIGFAKDADVLLSECSFPNSQKVEGHLIPDECGMIAKKANVGKLIINHLSPDISNKEILKQTNKIFNKTTLAEDLMKIII